MPDRTGRQIGPIASYGQAIATSLEMRGIDSAAVFSEAAVPLPASADPLRRISNEEVSRLFAIAVRITGDPYFGLQVGQILTPSSLHALGFGLLASTSLRDFYQRICNYYRVVSQNADFQQYEKDGQSILTAVNVVDSVCGETQDVFAVMILRFIRRLYQHDINPLWVDLLRPCPEDGDQPYLDYFKCPVQFGCSDLRFAMDSSMMDKPLPGASRELAQYNDEIVMGYLEKLEKQNLENRVRFLIISELASGTVSKQSIADGLYMSPRSLQLKLAALNTTFQDILDMTRQTLAQGYIEQSGLAITEIAYLLGFADTSNFTRAFKRWTGQPPSEYRAQLERGRD